MRARIAVMTTLALLMGAVSVARAQDYPSRPITIVFPGGPGIEPDRIARTVADKLREKWGQPVIVENRPGAGGNIGAEYVAKASPDGYTLLFTGVGALVLSKFLYSKLAYDPEAFVPVSVVVATPMVLVVHPKVPAQTLPQLIALAKTSPGKLNYGSAGNGTTTHLTGELFKSMAAVEITHVPYKGLGPALTDLMGEQVDMVVMDIGSALTNIRAGKIRALGVTTKSRSPLLPDVPAVGETLAGFASAFAFAMVAPPRTPPAIANRLSAAVSEAIKQPGVVKRLLDFGTEALGTSAAEMAATMVQERERWGAIVRSIGLKAD